MAQGKAKRVLLGIQGLIQHKTAPNWDFIYRVSLVRDEKWNIGDVTETPDGRVFVYAKSVGACKAGQGCEFTYTGVVPITTFATNHAVGVNEITIPAQTHVAVDKDELRGGYVILFDGDDNTGTGTRRIIGNDVSAADVAFNLRLDAGISNAIVSGTEKVEVFRNPYAGLQLCQSPNVAKAGLPASAVSATDMYFWVLKEGVCWIAPQSSVNTNDVGCGFRGDGSLDGYNHLLANDIDGVAEETSQYAGHRIIGNQTGNGPLFMLSM